MATKLKTFRSAEYAQVDGRLFPPGTPFTTAQKPAKGWEEINAAEAAAASGSQPMGSGAPALDSLSPDALKALAVERGVNIDGLTKKADIITALNASYEPHL